jgi:hypothetical protein
MTRIGADEPVLHVTNGDAVAAQIARAVRVACADVLPWRDALHDGPVPAGLGPDDLAGVRAAHLAARGWADEAAALAGLRERDGRLAARPEDAEVVLWFEDDLYDALQLAQIADRLAGCDGPVSIVHLRHPPRGDLAAAYARREPFAPERNAFAALRSSDPRAWGAHAYMDRLLEELPDVNTGLSRLERQILEAVAGFPLPPEALFGAVAEREDPPWLGDATVFAVARGLHPLMELADDRWELASEGHAVLSGRATRAAFDHWIGGVHLVPGDPGWAWDAERREAVRTE